MSTTNEGLSELIERSIRDKTTLEEESTLLSPENHILVLHALDRVARKIAAQMVRREKELADARLRFADDETSLRDAEARYDNWYFGAKRIHDAALTKSREAKERYNITSLLTDVAAYLAGKDDPVANRLRDRIAEISPASTDNENGAEPKDDSHDGF